MPCNGMISPSQVSHNIPEQILVNLVRYNLLMTTDGTRVTVGVPLCVIIPIGNQDLWNISHGSIKLYFH